VTSLSPIFTTSSNVEKSVTRYSIKVQFSQKTTYLRNLKNFYDIFVYAGALVCARLCALGLAWAREPDSGGRLFYDIFESEFSKASTLKASSQKRVLKSEFSKAISQKRFLESDF
jgi:hypothetical protein